MTNILKIILSIFVFLIFSVIKAQETAVFKLKLDIKNYPGLENWKDVIFSVSEDYDINLSKSKLETITKTKWQSVYINRLLKKVNKIKLKEYSLFHEFDNNLISTSKNTLNLFNKNKQIVFKKEFSNDFEITAIYKSNNTVLCAVSKFDKYCDNSFWQLYNFNLSTNKESVILTSNNSDLLNSMQQIAGKCPLLKNIAISPNKKNILINSTNIEYKDYCYNLVLKTEASKFKVINKSCDAILKDINFIDDENIVFIEQEHTGNHFKIKKYNIKYDKFSKQGCYNSSGIVGEYIKHEIIRKERLLKIYYRQDEFMYISDYDFNGKMLNQDRTIYFYKKNIKNNMYLSAINNRIFNLNTKTDKKFWEKPTIFHEYDILDFHFDDNYLLTIDEIGVLKYYDYKKASEYLLIVENSNKTLAIPVNVSVNDKRISEIIEKTNNAKESFVNKRINIEKERAAIEDAYDQIFEMNEINKENFVHNIENNISKNVIFELETNRTFHRAKVFHIIEYNNNKRYVNYSTGSLNKFIYNKKVKNQLLSILPNESIGYINNDEFLKIFEENKDKEIITIKLKYLNNKETDKILNSLLNLKKKEK